MTPEPLPAGRRIAPSILAADYARLGAQLAEVLDAGARLVHVDVMDGHFVPPITVGPLVVESIREQVHGAGAVLDVHLMIEHPECQVADFARAGADVITVHDEATPHLHRVLESIREHGALAGVAVNPATPADSLVEVAAHADLALCMTVNPGWGGQSFVPGSPAKVGRLRRLVGDRAALEVDGGIDVDTAPACAEAGADLFVAGSAVFGAKDPAAAYRALCQAVGAE
ncbi:MAG TPA: ribulose-phosphate 3-epimerase [Thermoleophilaceae bacterium]|nr:ribulose-phosphate 3-epimerase [Thermoleophilaceae bacterium]